MNFVVIITVMFLAGVTFFEIFDMPQKHKSHVIVPQHIDIDKLNLICCIENAKGSKHIRRGDYGP